VPDISNLFLVSTIDSFHLLKKYFFRMPPRNEQGFVWCSVILAQSHNFQTFMDKAKHALKNQNFSLWPKSSHHENASDIRWLLYSTCNQDEERLAALLLAKTGENIGVKWKPIRTSGRANKKKDSDDQSECIFALHLECATERLQEA